MAGHSFQQHRGFSFHPFLRASYPFDPSSLDSPMAGGCLCLQPGDLVLVHSFDKSGWADGSSLSHAHRGWVPSNYCEPYDPPQIRPLLLAALSALTGTRLEAAHSVQVASMTIISGVRFLLESTDCTKHDSPTLQRSSDTLRLARKEVLVQVSQLVECAKSAGSVKNLDSLLDNLVRHTQRLLVSCASLLIAWNSDEADSQFNDPVRLDFDVGSKKPLHSASTSLRTVDSSTRSSDIEDRSTVESCSDFLPVSALARLNSLFDTLLAKLSFFLNSTHLDERLPDKLLPVVRQAVNASRQFLSVVEIISERASPVVFSLDDAQEHVYRSVILIVSSARDLLAVSLQDEENNVLIESQNLIVSVTECMRLAAICFARAKRVLDTSGDFEFASDSKTTHYTVQIESRRPSAGSSMNEKVQYPDNQSMFLSSIAISQDLARQRDEKHMTAVEDRLILNSDGQVQGGSLEALVKNLTASDHMPSALFVNSFFLTFRLFTTPMGLTQTLIHRFLSISPDEHNLLAARLRILNSFRCWMESHWHADEDREAIGTIRDFVKGPVKGFLPSESQKLIQILNKLAEKQDENQLVPRVLSKVSRDTALGILLPDSVSVPVPIVSKAHMVTLMRYVKEGGSVPTVLEFDPLELARQLTVRESKLFCRIKPGELLGQEFSRPQGISKAVNVKAMSGLSTDLANLIGESIVGGETPLKYRMNVIKFWIRVAEKCLSLRNYNCLMEISCTLQSSVISRLKETWALLPQKYHQLFSELKSIIVYEKNYSSYRTILKNEATPCLPYLGVYLTDLTFADEGNSDCRIFKPNTEESCAVINFDKQMRTTRIITELQRFQVPYRLQVIPAIQAWLDVEIGRVRSMFEKDQHILYRRSCIIEPKKGVNAYVGAAVNDVPAAKVEGAISWREEALAT
ncbi:ras guanine nucleotide exchange factor domain-containing protein [Lipomyces oligophaga]|uniref:ras guanine nucleotide exchange factor domain-containing protein n=1 Tax=Lipomyces oligophaga TaxID=45792 RepID=UPI0034CE5EC6